MTSGSAFGTNIQPAAADVISQNYVQINEDLQWSEGSYRGFFTLTLNTTTATATYYAMRNISEHCMSFSGNMTLTASSGNANLDAFASATFVVEAGTHFQSQGERER